MNPRPGCAPVEPKSLIGIVGNYAHQRKNSLISFPTYELAIVELDDQGCCQERAQMRGLAKKYPVSTMMPRMRSSSFVHGWKHDARSDDDNLAHFRHVLEQAVYYGTGEKSGTATISEACPRGVRWLAGNVTL